jgi:hypothetical protein
VAEGGGLLNRYTLSRRIEGSNPSVSASRLIRMLFFGLQATTPSSEQRGNLGRIGTRLAPWAQFLSLPKIASIALAATSSPRSNRWA